MATILIVDDHPAMRLVLKEQLSQRLGTDQILEADNGQAAMEAVRNHLPDIVILDLDIPRVSGLDVAPRLRRIHPRVRILVLSGQDTATFAARASLAGAHGFVSKTQEIKEIVRCVEAVLAGYSVFPTLGVDNGSRRAAPANDESGLHRLSDREIAVLQLLARGHSHKAIAEILFISNKTVSSHKNRIMCKLRVHTLVDLVDFARRCRLVT